MQVEKSSLILNNVCDLVATVDVGTAIGKAIEDNVRSLKKKVKEVHEWNAQLEHENIQLKDQMGTSKMLMSALDDFKKCALEQADELHKTRKILYIHIQNLQDSYSAFRNFKIKAHKELVQLASLKRMMKDMTKWQAHFKDGP